MIKQGLFTKLFFLSVFSCILLIGGYAQDGSFKNISQQLNKFNELYSAEKIYLHSDKNLYLAGEIVWFKLYYLDGSTHQPIHASKVAYAEILDRNNKAVVQAKIPLTAEGGSGSFYLPLTINSDNYILRAYTNWMKNAGPQVFFEKQIGIVNTVKTATAQPAAPSTIGDIVFFPESGHLVEGIETKLAFHIVGKNGKGTSASGWIVSNTGDTVFQFSPYRFGIGNFNFKPEAAKTYTAVVVFPDGLSITRPLPVASASGYVMNVTDNKDGRLKVSVKAKSVQGQGGEEMFLFVHCRQAVEFSAQQYGSYNNEVLFFIDKSKLGEGVNHITLFNRAHQPVCERLVFNRPGSQATAQLATNAQVYNTRQAVDLSVSLKNDGDIDKANCSVSVYQVDSLQDAGDLTISNYLLLLSDLKGNVESPSYYFSNEGGVEEATDNLMMSHGWRRFNWENILNNRAGAGFKFIPEYRGHIISGRVVNVANGNAVAGADCYLSVPSSPFGFYMGKSDSTGIVRFDTKDYYGPGELIAQVAEENKRNYRVDLFSPFSDHPALSSLPAFNGLTKANSGSLLQRSIAMQAQNIYRADSIRQFTAPRLTDTLPFYGQPEYAYLLDNYKRFTTMEEVLREYVTHVNVALRNGNLHMSVFDDASKQIYQDNALVLVDGVPLADYNKIFTYDPLKIKKLEIVPRRYLFGPRLFSGIISFETYDGKFDAFELDPSLVAVDYEGLQMQREFYSPVYGGAGDSRVPDFRTTLYWKPNLSTDAGGNSNLRFYTSDQPGKFIVVLQGITKNGKPVYGTSFFSVK